MAWRSLSPETGRKSARERRPFPIREIASGLDRSESCARAVQAANS